MGTIPTPENPVDEDTIRPINKSESKTHPITTHDWLINSKANVNYCRIRLNFGITWSPNPNTNIRLATVQNIFMSRGHLIFIRNSHKVSLIVTFTASNPSNFFHSFTLTNVLLSHLLLRRWDPVTTKFSSIKELDEILSNSLV